MKKISKILSTVVATILCMYVFADAYGVIDDPLHILGSEKTTETDGKKTDTVEGNGEVKLVDYSNTIASVSGESIPAFDGYNDAYVLNENTPFFTSEDLVYTETYTNFSPLDERGRAGIADSVIGAETMQDHDRGSIADIHPSGWWEAKQTDVNVNRSHLIGNQLAGDVTDCAENMITGSRQLNAGTEQFSGSMLQYENQIADFIKNSDFHVRYRVTPVFENNDSTAKGVLMEAESMEDQGESLKICVYIYNVQPGYECDYQTGIWEKVTTAEVHEDAK